MSTAAGGSKVESWGVGLAMLLAACPTPSEDDGGTESTATPTGTSTVAPSTDDETMSSQTDAPMTTEGPTDDGPLDSSGTDDGMDTDEPTTAGAECGNGVTDPGEACDDGNEIDADGCNQDCTISGSVLWFHSQASGTGQDEEFWDVAVDSQGQAYAAGDFYGTNLDLIVRQYTDEDALGWTQVVNGTTGNDGARGIARDGSTLFTAGYTAVAGQSNNIWLKSFSLDGDPGITVAYNSAISGSDVGQGVAIDPGGNVIVVGSYAVDLQGSNIFVREYTPAGGVVWTAAATSPGAATDQARAVATDGSGNVAVAGFLTVGGQQDIWVRVYDTNGAVQWTASHASASGSNDQAWGVAFDPDGNVVVAGYEEDPAIPWRLFLRKYDPAGMELWDQPWEGDMGMGARAFGMAIDSAGDIVVTGQHYTGTISQFLVRKVDPDGNERWTTLIDGAPDTSQVGRGVTIGPNNRVWVVGGVDFGVDGRDAYIARLAP